RPLVQERILEMTFRQTNFDAERINQVSEERVIRTPANDRQSKVERFRAVRNERAVEQNRANELAGVRLDGANGERHVLWINHFMARQTSGGCDAKILRPVAQFSRHFG